MSWLKDSLNSVKGQITNFASEVLAEGIVEDSNETFTGLEAAELKVRELDDRCRSQDEEIVALKKLTDELQKTLQSERLTRKNGVASREEESSWYWDPPAKEPPPDLDRAEQASYRRRDKKLSPQDPDEAPYLSRGKEPPPADDLDRQDDLSYPKRAKEPPEAGDQLEHQDELSFLKRPKHQRDDNSEELNRLREENANLTANLEDLDNQHQQAMERLLTLKKELQKNFEFLKQEHEDLKSANDEYVKDIAELKKKLAEKDEAGSKASNAEYETLHHKYVNLERVHSLLQETTEKFQEENQELHEEVFKLQEELAKNEHVDERHNQVTDMIPRDKYEALLKEVVMLQENRRSTESLHLDDTNIDDNAKSVIENLKRDISDLKHRLAHKNEVEAADSGASSARAIETEKLMQLYNKYINFELPVDYVGEMPSTGESNLLYKIENALRVVSTYKKEINVLDRKLSEEKLNESHLQRQIDDLTSDNEFLTADLQQCERELSEMKKNNDFLLSEITALKNASKLEPIIEAHEDNIVKLESELADCNKINKGFQNEIRTIEKELSEVKKEKVLLQTDLNDLRDKYNHMLLELDTYKSQSATVQQLELDTQRDHSEKLRKALEEIDDLKRKLTTTASKNEQLNISHSIIENEKVLLTNDLDELKHQLEERSNTQKELEAVKMVMEHKLQDIEKKMHELLKEKADIENDRHNLIEKVNMLTQKTENIIDEKEYMRRVTKAQDQSQKYISEVESTIVQHRATEAILRAEIEELKKSDNSKVNDKIIELSKEKSALLENIASQYNDLQEYKKRNEELKLEVENLRSNLHSNHGNTSHLENEIIVLRSKLGEHQSCMKEIEGLRQDKHHLLEIKTQFEKDLAMADERMTSVGSKLEQISMELKTKDDEIVTLNATIQENNVNAERLNESIINLKNDVTNKEEKIRLYRETINELNDKLVAPHADNDVSEINVLKKEIMKLKDEILDKKTALQDMQNKLDLANKTVIDSKTLCDNLTAEKAELVVYITAKHNESIQYHNEIQRLNHVVLQHEEEHRKVLEQYESLKKHADNNHTECENLRGFLRERDERLRDMNERSNGTETNKTELLYATETIQNLTEKCEELDKKLTIQLDAVKKLTAEKSQVAEREQALVRELERLRRHLAESEETHTQELLASEQKLSECQSKLFSIEERAKQSGTVYTSNSIRANQELETLRNQIRLLERQREEAQARLGEADDSNKRNDAALNNLQLVLQQFQSDKERDIEVSTLKIRRQLEEERSVSEALRAEVKALGAKLEESMEGLKAAARLGGQLETRSAQLADYKEQVRALQETVRASEERYRAASGQQERVDKGLVKNLLLNYVEAAARRAADRTQVLRVLSTVLDFNQQECERVGLARGAAAGGGGAGGAVGGDSLAREFVRFLEKESRPSAPLPSMMSLGQGPPSPAPSASSRSATPLSRKNSGLGPQPTPFELYGHRRTTSSGSGNLLLLSASEGAPATATPTATPTATATATATAAPEHTGVNVARHSEGAILKHVLKDDI